MPEQIAWRLSEYFQQRNFSAEERILATCDSTARALMMKLAGRLKVVLIPPLNAIFRVKIINKIN
jgi:hypothetical protein